MLRITNLKVPFNEKAPLAELVAQKLKCPLSNIDKVYIRRLAIDARRYKNAPIYKVYTLDIDIKKQALIPAKISKKFSLAKPPKCFTVPQLSLTERPIVVGFGPAGIFCALTLCRAGLKPIILERGYDVDKRAQAIASFWRQGHLDTKSNVQFGEGGAGTFSDGKLTTRINDSKIGAVLQDFVDAGAPEEILYLHKPHIGTDILKKVIKNLREKIISFGGEIHFSTRLKDIEIENKHLQKLYAENGEQLPTPALFLGIGHSARDTFEMLYKRGVAMEAKPFAVGVRIEHPQALIDKAQYGDDFNSPSLPVADYAVTFHDKEKGLSCYSFCMCPGGQVVAAASEEGRITTNGMSNYLRNSGIANSALIVPVGPQDFGFSPLDGIAWQRHYEEVAFRVGGSNYFAPVQSVGDFLQGQINCDSFLTEPTYLPGVQPADLRNCLPDKVVQSLAAGLQYFDNKIPGFSHPRALLTGVEMRSSSPCRLLRDKKKMHSVNVDNLYPIGEGAGYAGGIMSAAIDGVNAALSYITKKLEK